MSLLKDIKLPPLSQSLKQRNTYGNIVQNYNVKSEEGQEREIADAVYAQPALTSKVRSSESSYIYATPGRKPQLLEHLESHVKQQLQTISPCEPKYQELKLQVFRRVFGILIKEFKTYQPLLSAIKKEFENALEYQQDQIRKLEPLQYHLRLVTEECDRKIQVRCKEEQAEIGALKREKQQLQGEVVAMRKKEKATQAVIDHLQSELSKQYVQYREQCDARKMLIWQLNEQSRGSVKQEHAANEEKDTVELQLALKVCREDLTKTKEELIRMKAEYWDVVPRRNWEILEHTHEETLLQLKTLQTDFNQLRSEHNTLLELQKKGTMQPEMLTSTADVMEKCLSLGQSQTQSSEVKELVRSSSAASGTLTSQRTAFPLKPDEEIERVESARSESDSSDDAISSQRLHSLIPRLGETASPPLPDESDENAPII